MPTYATVRVVQLCGAAAIAAIAILEASSPKAQTTPAITISRQFPSELNPDGGGAPNATLSQAAAFAWQEFIAANWPAGPQQGQPGQRDAPSMSCKFGDPTCTGPLVWETFRGKVEIFPGTGNPPGYVNDKSADYGYDALPQYANSYGNPSPVPACDPTLPSGPTPWVNLDETDQITLNSMYAGVVTAQPSAVNSAPQIVRFLAKANRAEYVYVAKNSDPNDPNNQWWSTVPGPVQTATLQFLKDNQASPPADSSTYVSLPYNTVEIKAGWRVLNPSEAASGRFHMAPVRYYETTQPGNPSPDYTCYRDGRFGLVALHIIQKTQSAPYFIYATFEQADNILTPAGTPLEDVDGNIVQPVPATSRTPQTCLVDPQPSSTAPANAPPGQQTTKANPLVMLTPDPATCTPIASPIPLAQQYCDAPGPRLYYQNTAAPMGAPSRSPAGGFICVNKRDNDIPPEVIAANGAAHAAIAAYLQQNGIASAPWLYYKLVNVQYYPVNKTPNPAIPNGSPYTAQPPYSAQNPYPSTFYQANIVVETNRALQLFSGGLIGFPDSGANTDWDPNPMGGSGITHVNTYYGGKGYNMGGCMGCHGSQGQRQAGDFSVILANGGVIKPEFPAQPTKDGALRVPRNRFEKTRR